MTRNHIAHRADFSVRCACGIVYKSDDNHIGKQIKCRCGRTVTIARPKDEYVGTVDDTPRRRRRRRSRAGAFGDKGRGMATRLRRVIVAMRKRLVGASDTRNRRSLRRWPARLAWAWFVFVVVTWLLLITTSERFLPASMLAYGPRFVMLAPFVVLIPVAAILARRALLPLTLALLVVIGPIMGGRLSWRTTFTTLPTSPPPGAMRVMSYNSMGGDRVSHHLRTSLEDLRPDVVGLQECGNVLWDSVQAITDWHSARVGGTCTLSRWRITSVDSMPREDFARIAALGYGGAGVATRHIIETPNGPMAVVNVHLETARKGLFAFLGDNPALLKALGIKPMSSRRVLNARGSAEDRAAINAEIRDRESAHAARWAFQGDTRTPVIVVGDFNLPVESTIFREHWGSFTDAFNVSGTGFGWTKREGSLLHIRIDHILVSAAAPRPVGTWLGPDLGSDHLPVIADLAWRR